MEQDTEFTFGKVTSIGWCCGKPVGCGMRPEGCLFKKHPWKRAHIDRDPTVRCQATGLVGGQWEQCTLLNLHAGPHETKAAGPDPTDLRPPR